MTAKRYNTCWEAKLWCCHLTEWMETPKYSFNLCWEAKPKCPKYNRWVYLFTRREHSRTAWTPVDEIKRILLDPTEGGESWSMRSCLGCGCLERSGGAWSQDRPEMQPWGRRMWWIVSLCGQVMIVSVIDRLGQLLLLGYKRFGHYLIFWSPLQKFPNLFIFAMTGVEMA